MSALKDTNLLIEASAGTGKTQALAERLIALLHAGVKPQEIIALTFSRAAAGEIFERFVTLLADRAENDPASAACLRDVIATQHLSQIGTLDSFLMKIVRAFPLELGLMGQLEMMDDYQAGSERSRLAFSILRKTDAQTKRSFFEAFSLAMDHADVRSFVEAYHAFIAAWHEHVLAKPEPSAWGEAKVIWGEEKAFLSVTERELAEAAANLESVEDSKEMHALAEWVRNFRGSFDNVAGYAKKLLEVTNLFTGETATVEFDFGRGRNNHHAYGGPAAQAIRTAMLCVYGYVLRQKLELARGIYQMVSAFERRYDADVRKAGKLVFGDIPRLITALPGDAHVALEYRLDTHIKAWALDEFQDTSREQWKALKNLIEEAKQSDGAKSVFIVGDRKQAIYGWRNGDVSIFTHEEESGAYKLDELKKTYRSAPQIVEAVNRIFAWGKLKEDFPGWTSPEHVSAKPNLVGFVQALDAPGRKMEDFVEPIANALKAVDPVRRGLSAAILVRSNTFGEFLADQLKLLKVEGVVWEGESAVLDTPALMPFLDLIQLAEHPGDEIAARHFALTPLAAAKYPQGIPSAAEISREMAESLTTQGLVRTLRALRALLPSDSKKAWSAFTEERFVDMLRAANDFELSRKPGTRLSDFADFLKSQKKRNLAEPGKIKIMTIHRSKGLGFDYVVLPLYEPKGLSLDPDAPLESEAWILPNPSASVARAMDGLQAAYQERRHRAEQEALCTYYVAMTRAKRALTIICHPAARNATDTRRFSDYVRETVGHETLGDPAWYETPPEEQEKPSDAVKPLGDPTRGPRQYVARRMPSQAFAKGTCAGDLFAVQNARALARKKGTAAHAAWEKIEWINPTAPKNDFEAEILNSDFRLAFVKPSSDATVWRERSYELFVNNTWETGQFDRVVFEGSGDSRRAIIYDFKTNAKHSDETEEAFVQRMQETYAGQMHFYRQALNRLTRLPLSRISTCLLLQATHRIIPA